jgi:DNA-directed RNA polymerase subunit N (RpoN/RPB10)
VHTHRVHFNYRKYVLNWIENWIAILTFILYYSNNRARFYKYWPRFCRPRNLNFQIEFQYSRLLDWLSIRKYSCRNVLTNYVDLDKHIPLRRIGRLRYVDQRILPRKANEFSNWILCWHRVSVFLSDRSEHRVTDQEWLHEIVSLMLNCLLVNFNVEPRSFS